MKKRFAICSLFIILTAIIASFISIFFYVEQKAALYLKNVDKQIEPTLSQLSKIFQTGKIRMITENSSNSYYIYRDQPMGFEYELAKEFASFLQVELEIITPDIGKIFENLESDKGDFVATGVAITEKRSQSMLFTQPYMEIEQKLIFNKKLKPIYNINKLSDITIHVSQNTTHHERLLELKKRGIDINMVVHDDLCTEELLRMVSENEDGVSYTIADSHIALLNSRYYPDIEIGISIQEKEYLAWAVRKTNLALCDKMIQFFDIIRHNGVFYKLYEKYYGHLDLEFDYPDIKAFHEDVEIRLPKIQKTIIKESEKYGFDWRIIAALVYQESNFNPTARSETGVRGLMQVTEKAAKEMGISNRKDPNQNLKAGIGYLNSLYLKFSDVYDNIDRIKLSLASYNVGYGHVFDAQLIAKQKGLNPNHWNSIEKTLPLLTRPKYYSKTKYGYARGHESVSYVKKIFSYYDILKQKAHSAG